MRQSPHHIVGDVQIDIVQPNSVKGILQLFLNIIQAYQNETIKGSNQIPGTKEVVVF